MVPSVARRRSLRGLSTTAFTRDTVGKIIGDRDRPLGRLTRRCHREIARSCRCCVSPSTRRDARVRRVRSVSRSILSLSRGRDHPTNTSTRRALTPHRYQRDRSRRCVDSTRCVAERARRASRYAVACPSSSRSRFVGHSPRALERRRRSDACQSERSYGTSRRRTTLPHSHGQDLLSSRWGRSHGRSSVRADTASRVRRVLLVEGHHVSDVTPRRVSVRSGS